MVTPDERVVADLRGPGVDGECPCLDDSFQLMRFLTEWERLSRIARNAAPHEMVSGGAETVEPEGP